MLSDLWDSYFKDSGSALIEAFTIIKAESINQTNYNNDTEFVTLAISSLINKLAEYEGFFSKYRKKTRAYAERSGNILKFYIFITSELNLIFILKKNLKRVP